MDPKVEELLEAAEDALDALGPDYHGTEDGEEYLQCPACGARSYTRIKHEQGCAYVRLNKAIDAIRYEEAPAETQADGSE